MSSRESPPIPEGAQGHGAELAVLRDLEEHLEKEGAEEKDDGKPSVLPTIPTGEKEGGGNTVDKLASVWESKFWPEDSDHFHNVTWKYQKLLPFLSPQMAPASRPRTVVLHGAAGVGKTTLAKRTLLDWTEFRSGSVHCAFYLSCRELNRVPPCTFAELISKDCPELRDVALEVLAQAENVLFVVDGFEELRVPARALICDSCSDLNQEKPAPILLSSLLRRKMVAKAILLVTTWPEALDDLMLLLQQPQLAEKPQLVEVEGFSGAEREACFLRHFEDPDQAQRALDAVRRNPALLHLGAAPAVCQLLCTCLRLLMQRGEDPSSACRTTTSLFLRFLCDQFTPAPSGRPQHHLGRPLKALCLLAAQGLWTQMSLFDREDLEPFEVGEADLQPFLDRRVLQRDRDRVDCFSFVHLSVQQFLAAAFYILRFPKDSAWQGCTLDIRGMRELFCREARARNPQLAQAGRFLWGLLNVAHAWKLEGTFGCQTTGKAALELLKCTSEQEEPALWAVGMREVFHCLYESQDEELVSEATATLREVSLQLTTSLDLLHCSFCLRHCRDLQRLSLQVAKGVLPEEEEAAREPDAQDGRSQQDQDLLPLWRKLCSVFSSNKSLVFLDLSHSFLGSSFVKTLCDQLASASCCLQRVVLKNLSPPGATQNLCLAFRGHKTLMHLTLQGSEQDHVLPSLHKVLSSSRCKLQCLRLGPCSAPAPEWADLSQAFQFNRSLTCLNLSDCELLDEGAKLLCSGLKHPMCPVERLSLENCHLTEACCKELAVILVISPRLLHLCLAKNNIGDHGLKTLCEVLHYPYCPLQTLVLWCCSITSKGCDHLSTVLRQGSSLTHLDLGLNHVGFPGLEALCKALKASRCRLQCLWLRCCYLTPFCCWELSSALRSNRSLHTLDLGQNPLGFDGVKMLCEALDPQNSPLQVLRVNTEESNAAFQNLLDKMKASNPGLTIDNSRPQRIRPSAQEFLF